MAFWGPTSAKMAKATFTTNKIIATVFWIACVIILGDYLEKGKTINGVMTAFFYRLNQAVKKNVLI